MALKPDRNYTNGTDISYFMNHVAERGGVVVFSTVGSGSAMDQSSAVVVGSGAASGTVPAGLLLNDMVNKDLTQTHINWHKDEVQLGGKVTVLRQGTVVTNVIAAAEEPGVGSGAFYASETFGSDTNKLVLSVTNPNDSVNNHHRNRVGTFLSSKDEDGYAKVAINIV